MKTQLKHRHLHKLLVQLSDRLQLLVLYHSGLLQDLLLLFKQILQTEETLRIINQDVIVL